MPEYNVVDDEPGSPPGSPIPQPTSPGQELLLGRFKTQEELIKAYQELEGTYTKETQTRADLERQNQELLRRDVNVVKEPPVTLNDNELFWQNPVEVINKIVTRSIAPITTSHYENQKERFRSDPEFRKYEAQIDLIASNYPDVKTQPNIVENLYKMVRGLNFNPEEFERTVREKIKTENQMKTDGTIEGGGALPPNRPGEPMVLTEEEKTFAYKWYSNLDEKITPEEAYKKYVESKKGYWR